MVFLVLPLKAPVARMVIRERMDYKDYLGGSLKDELDGLESSMANLSSTLLTSR